MGADRGDQIVDTLHCRGQWRANRSRLQVTVVNPPQHIAGDLGALPCAAEKDAASQGCRRIGNVIPHRPGARRLRVTAKSGLAIFHRDKRPARPLVRSGMAAWLTLFAHRNAAVACKATDCPAPPARKRGADSLGHASCRGRHWPQREAGRIPEAERSASGEKTTTAKISTAAATMSEPPATIGSSAGLPCSIRYSAGNITTMPSV